MQDMPNNETLNVVNSDIVVLTKLASGVGWDSIRELSVYRMLYLASILYSFKYPHHDNMFSRYYHFDIDSAGPYSDEIKKSLVFLESNEYLIRNDNSFKLNPERADAVLKAAIFSEKENWLKAIIYILGLYGEGKIYEFVIRDPQYQDHIERNVPKELDIEGDNKTIRILNKFKQAFEKNIGDKATGINDTEYLTLYFEYVFSKVVKGEIDL